MCCSYCLFVFVGDIGNQTFVEFTVSWGTDMDIAITPMVGEPKLMNVTGGDNSRGGEAVIIPAGVMPIPMAT